jgi:hypothetical protein
MVVILFAQNKPGDVEGGGRCLYHISVHDGCGGRKDASSALSEERRRRRACEKSQLHHPPPKQNGL